MIRPCDPHDIRTIYEIINDASQAYKGVIPPDCWKEPYMAEEELRRAMDEGVTFWGYEENGILVGVMGTQEVEDVILIRHAYVRTRRRNQGIGSKLLTHLRRRATRSILVGTWADALWAIRFYEKHGFRKVRPEEKDSLLRKYWSLPERQVETSVVLAESGWFESVNPSDNRRMSSSGTGGRHVVRGVNESPAMDAVPRGNRGVGPLLPRRFLRCAVRLTAPRRNRTQLEPFETNLRPYSSIME